jgi:hypothetical protein
MELRHSLGSILFLLCSTVVLAAGEVVIVPPSGGSFVVKDGSGQNRAFEVTSEGDILVDGKELDFLPPEVVITAPDFATGGMVDIKVDFTDDKGLFRVLSETPDADEGGILLNGETSTSVEYSTYPAFGDTTIVEAYATDLGGNTTVSAHEIVSNTIIKPGSYILSAPLVLEVDSLVCNMHEPYTASLVAFNVSAKFKSEFQECDWRDDGESPAAVACVSVIGQTSSGYLPSGVNVDAAIDSVEASSFAKDQKNSGGSGSGESYDWYTNMSAQFTGGAVPTISAVFSIRCESSVHGTLILGPYNVSGSLAN